MTYDLSDIMRHAWAIFRKTARWSFATCLRKAWSAAKAKLATAAGRTICAPAGETAKAVKFEAIAACEATDQERKVTVWLPKSQIKDGIASAWIMKQKAADIRARFGYSGTLTVSGVTQTPFYA